MVFWGDFLRVFSCLTFDSLLFRFFSVQKIVNYSTTLFWLKKFLKGCHHTIVCGGGK